jgi:hypothetical protein
MSEEPKARTHVAFTMQRIGKKIGRWLEVGSGRIDAEGVHVFLDRLPVGGFTGYVRLTPHGKPPPLPQPQPRRPAGPAGSGEEEEFEE